MRRSQLQSQFAAEFQRGSRPVGVTLAELDSLEQDLGMLLPNSYRTFLLEQGPIATPTIPDLVAESREWSLPPVSEFCPPAIALSVTRSAWKSGLPRSLMAFATGPDQTLFCFERGPKGRRRPDEAAVWYFDPITEPGRISGSFDGWLHEYWEAVYVDNESRRATDELADQAAGKELKKRRKP
jgi:hypothetical protein